MLAATAESLRTVFHLAPGTGTKDWSIHIVGSDLLPSAIEVAERGLYPQSALTGLPPAAIRACFSKIGSSNGIEQFKWQRQEGSQNGATNGIEPTHPAMDRGMARLTMARICW